MEEVLFTNDFCYLLRVPQTRAAEVLWNDGLMIRRVSDASWRPRSESQDSSNSGPMATTPQFHVCQLGMYTLYYE
ncbi:hypothetical protein HW555_002805 [Spodoptera exigua]|uniref:Uncharacterized protein n=1 Tax=Spodoptera exigua TaxID=7107 RepID=A0A835L9V2_SPOEX|nr:hypothetical protein HW555_002805 [Spodoptera exigua]